MGRRSDIKIPTKEELENLYHEHRSAIKIAKILGVTDVAVGLWLRKYNIKVILFQKKECPDIKKFTRMWKSVDISNEDIASEFNVGLGLILKWSRQLKLGKRTPYRNNEKGRPDKSFLEKMYHEGHNLRTIGHHFSVTGAAVKNWFIYYGIELRPHTETIKMSAPKAKQTNLIKYGRITSFPENLKRTSFGEIQMIEMLNEKGFQFVKDRHTLPNDLELDGFDEKRMVAFEHCGLYHHSEKGWNPRKGTPKMTSRNQHQMKFQMCRNLGIRLYTVFGDEWINQKEKIIRYICANNGMVSERIAARKTIFREIDPKIARKFCEENHMQGTAMSIRHAFGLIRPGGDLLNVMTFGQHHRESDKIVMNRFCGIPDVSVVGGASRLMKNAHQRIGEDILTWSDSRWSAGNVYDKMGCVMEEELGPDYYWVHNDKRYGKQTRRKSATGQPIDMSEKEYNESLGMSRIWDCGKIRWRYGGM